MIQEDRSLRVPQRDKTKVQCKIKEFPWTERQKEFINLCNHKDVKIILVDGPAGTAKTCLAVFCALQQMNEKRVGEILYIRTVVESASKNLGFLPGLAEDKFKPFAGPLEDKLEELISKPDIDRLTKKENRIQAIPYNYLRGLTFNATFIIADEAQNATFSEIVTLLTRFGKFSKLIICGDSLQADINGKSGFKQIFNIFNQKICEQNGIFCFNFNKEDIVRSDTVKFILEILEPIIIANRSKNI